MVGTAGYQAAAELLVAWLSRLGLAAYRGNSYRLDYAAGSMAGVNIAATLPGHSRERPPLVLAAHYDSVMATPCADDNAVAVAICLQVVARLAPQPLLRDLVLIFFDAEEPPFTGTDAMGSIHFYRHQMDRRGVHALVVQDLIGHDVNLPVGGKEIRAPLLRDLVFMTGVESHSHLHQMVASSPLPRRLRLLSAPNRHIGNVSGYLMFRCQDVPYLFLSCGRWRHYHRASDTTDRLNYRKMARLVAICCPCCRRSTRPTCRHQITISRLGRPTTRQ